LNKRLPALPGGLLDFWKVQSCVRIVVVSAREMLQA